VNAADRVVSDMRKYDRGLTNLLHDDLHWLDVPEREQYKLCSTVHRCLQHKAPHSQYMKDCCIQTSDIACRQHLRSAAWLPSAACAATPSFSVRSSGLFYGRPGGLELITRLSS